MRGRTCPSDPTTAVVAKGVAQSLSYGVETERFAASFKASVMMDAVERGTTLVDVVISCPMVFSFPSGQACKRSPQPMLFCVAFLFRCCREYVLAADVKIGLRKMLFFDGSQVFGAHLDVRLTRCACQHLWVTNGLTCFLFLRCSWPAMFLQLTASVCIPSLPDASSQLVQGTCKHQEVLNYVFDDRPWCACDSRSWRKMIHHIHSFLLISSLVVRIVGTKRVRGKRLLGTELLGQT